MGLFDSIFGSSQPEPTSVEEAPQITATNPSFEGFSVGEMLPGADNLYTPSITACVGEINSLDAAILQADLSTEITGGIQTDAPDVQIVGDMGPSRDAGLSV